MNLMRKVPAKNYWNKCAFRIVRLCLSFLSIQRIFQNWNNIMRWIEKRKYWRLIHICTNKIIIMHTLMWNVFLLFLLWNSFAIASLYFELFRTGEVFISVGDMITAEYRFHCAQIFRRKWNRYSSLFLFHTLLICSPRKWTHFDRKNIGSISPFTVS